MIKRTVLTLTLIAASSNALAGAAALVLLAPTATIGGVSYLSSKQSGTSQEMVHATEKAFGIHSDILVAAQPEAQAFNADRNANLSEIEKTYPVLHFALQTINTGAAQKGVVYNQNNLIDYIAQY